MSSMKSGSSCNEVSTSWQRERSTIDAHPEPGPGRVHDALRHHDEMIAACDIHVEQKADEVAIVVMPDAIIDPWTVMI